MPRIVTAEEFAALDPFWKGYAVYMAGSRDDQPNIPERYTPAPEDQDAFDRGQMRAVIEVQDTEE